MSFGSLLRHRVTIRRIGNTPGADTSDWNQEPEAWADLATSVPCRIDEGGGRELTLPDTSGTVVVDAVVFMLPGTDVSEHDLLVQAGGYTYEVLLVRDAAGAGHHLELDCRVVR